MVTKTKGRKVEDTMFEPNDDTKVEETGEPATVNIDFETVKAAKARRVSAVERGEDGKILRKGKNLSGNQPFKTKLYALGAVAPEIAIKAAPMQVQLIYKYMADTKIEGTGGQIVQGAINAGYLKTKIDPPVLFAYYRRLLEKLGVEHIG